MSAGPATDVAALGRRSIIGTWRQPQAWVPSLFFPLLLAAVYSSQFARAIDLPGFPEVDSFLDFILPASVLQGVAFGANAGATDLALDIETGFMDRLLASPTSRSAILIGRLTGAAVFGAFEALVLLTVFLIFGATIAGGFGAALVLLLVAMGLALAIGGLGCAIALRTGSQEAVQSTFPLIFVLLFLSSAFFPTDLMEGWYQAVAEANPLTWIIDPVRGLLTQGFDVGDATQALAITAGFAVVSIVIALTQLRYRIRVAG